MKSSFFAFLLLFVCVSQNPLQAQVVPIVTKVTVSSAVEKQPVSVSVELAQNTSVRKVTLKYRSFGESAYKELEMLLAGRTATATLLAEAVLPPYIEYFIEVSLEGGNKEFYPVMEPQPGQELKGPEANPLQITVNQRNPKDQEAVLLSPEPGETVALEDLAISVSLFYASDAVNAAATKISLDGIDVSKDAVRSDEFIVYSPKNFSRPLNLGTHFIKVELRDTLGNVYHTIESSFNLSTAAAITAEETRFQARGNAQLEYRNENVAATGVNYIRGDIRSDASYRFANFGGSVHLDNQDTPERQPQNRFLFYADAKYLRIEVGDAFPKFPSLIVSGKRVRGVSGSLATGYFNLDVSFGQTERDIEGILSSRDTVFVDSSSVNARPKNSVRTGNYFTYNIFNRGTYARNFLAVRPSFGSGENFQLGFTYMHAKDDAGSIKYGILPAENLVVGTDLLLAYDDQHIKWETQASVGIVNTDISKGNFTTATFDSMRANTSGTDSLKKLDDIKTLENLSNLASKFITVNENLTPVDPRASGLPGISFESAFSLNYFNNFLRVQGFRRGAAYKSFGNEYLQTDIQGAQVSDYLRLFTNRVFVSLSYELKADNTASTKEVTTKFNNLNSSITLNIGARIPSLQIGYALYGRNADLDLTMRNALTNRPDSANATKSADDQTSRIFVASSYDFEAGLRHSASISVSISDRKDQTIYQRNQKNSFIQVSLVSNFNFPLQTNVSFVTSKNESHSMLFKSSGTTKGQDSTDVPTNFDYSILSLGAQYRMMEDNLRLSAILSPSFGALSRTTLQAAADFTYMARHNFSLQFDYIRNGAPLTDDTILSFIYRFTF